MAKLNYGLLQHPVAQRFPKNEAEWVDFIRVLVEATSNPDSIDVAIEGGSAFSDAPSTESRASDDIEALQIGELMDVPSTESRSSADIEALQIGELMDSASEENRRFVPVPEWQYENSSNNGEDIGPNVGTGYVPAASDNDDRIDPIFGNPTWGRHARDRGLTYWDESTLSLHLRTDAPGHEVEVGKQVVYRVITASAVSKGDLVYANGSWIPLGNKGAQVVSLADASGTGAETNILGMMLEDCGVYQFGYCVAFGNVDGTPCRQDSDGNTATTGDIMFLSENTPGGWTVDPPRNRIKIGILADKGTGSGAGNPDGQIRVRISNELHYTLNSCSFHITGTGASNPTINKEFNASSITRTGTGTYLVTVDRSEFDFNPLDLTFTSQNVLNFVVENWTAKSTTVGAGGNIEQREAHITTLGTTSFTFTFYEVVAPAVAAPVELVPMDMTANDTVTFFGQMLSFTAP